MFTVPERACRSILANVQRATKPFFGKRGVKPKRTKNAEPVSEDISSVIGERRRGGNNFECDELAAGDDAGGKNGQEDLSFGDGAHLNSDC